MKLFRIVASLAVALAGCSLDTAIIADGGATDSGAALDSQVTDAERPDSGSPPRDGGTDASVSVMDTGPVEPPLDSGALDSGVPDTGPPDTGLPDTGPPDTGIPCHLRPETCPGELGGHCDARSCREGECCTDGNCGAQGLCLQRCGGGTGCPSGMGCEHGFCFFGCSGDGDCAAGMTCEHGNTICEY